jgi:hypothetical protein
VYKQFCPVRNNFASVERFFQNGAVAFFLAVFDSLREILFGNMQVEKAKGRRKILFRIENECRLQRL